MTQRNSALITLPPLLDQSQNVFAHICDCSIMLQYICQPLIWRIQDDKSSSVCFSALPPPPQLVAQLDEIFNHPKGNIAQQYNTSSLSLHHTQLCTCVFVFVFLCVFGSQPPPKVKIRVSQKIQKSEFWNVTYPFGFHRLDEPPEKISALQTHKRHLASHFQFYIVITMGKSAKNLIWS